MSPLMQAFKCVINSWRGGQLIEARYVFPTLCRLYITPNKGAIDIKEEQCSIWGYPSQTLCHPARESNQPNKQRLLASC